MDKIEAFMIIRPWHIPFAMLILGFMAGLLVKAIWDKVQDHETSLEVRTRDVDEHTLVTGEDAC